MQHFKSLMAALLAMGLIIGGPTVIVGCDDEPDDLEDVGEQLEDGAEEVGDDIEDATD